MASGELKMEEVEKKWRRKKGGSWVLRLGKAGW